MPTLYLTEQYALVRRDTQDCLLIQIPERRSKDGTPSPARHERIPLLNVEDVVVIGEVGLTTAALHLLLERTIEITLLSYYGQFKGQLSPACSKKSLLRMAQHRAHHDLSQRCELARRFVIGKLSNQLTLLRRYNRTQPDAERDAGIDAISTCIDRLRALSLAQLHTTQPLMSGDHRVEGTPLATILGLEGAGSAAYFRCFGGLLVAQNQWPFAQRIKRPPPDPVNSLLSFGYSLLTNKVASAVQIVGLDHFVGYLHSSRYGRPALALDLMEEFRPLIVDSVVLKLLNKRMLTPGDFTQEVGAYYLKQAKQKVFFRAFEDRLNEEIIHPLFGYKVSYRRCIELQARLLAKVLTGEIDAYPPLRIR